MWWLNKYANKKEPLFEPIFRQLRFGVFQKLEKLKIKKRNLAILDWGCGPEARFYYYLKDHNWPVDGYVGYDPLFKETKSNKINVVKDITDLKEESFDLITMLAVLEHMNLPDLNFKPILSKLKKGGYLFLTTPTVLAKPVLEFLSSKLKLVSKREIKEHKHYYSKKEIMNIFGGINGLEYVNWGRFELLFNQYAIFKKT